MKRTLLAALSFLVATSLGAQIADDAAIRTILAERIASGGGVGMVVGVIDSRGTRIVALGTVSKTDARRVDANTVFEIGAITKPFTALLLAEMIERGAVKGDDPISKYLPAGVCAPERNGKVITLEQLAMHTSGLPRIMTNLPSTDPLNPYAGYSTAQLYDFLNEYELSRDPGATYEYSNPGVALLGHLLARRAGTSYETLLRQRILAPLGMRSTFISIPPDAKKHLAQGHDARLQPVPDWDLGALAGAGALRSTANDLLRFLSAQLRKRKSPLAPAMKRALASRRQFGDDDVAFSWEVAKLGDREIYWHHGRTGGYRSYVGFDPAHGNGVVVLSNVAIDVDDIGRQLLAPHATAPTGSSRR